MHTFGLLVELLLGSLFPQLDQHADGCRYIVSADLHSARFGAELIEAMAADAHGDMIVLVGDTVDVPGEWPSWRHLLTEYDVRGVPGNHDDGAGHQRYLGPVRSECIVDGETRYAVIGLDSHNRVSRSEPDLAWAAENHPDTPWLVFVHRPFVSCIHPDNWRTYGGGWMADQIPADSIVVVGHEHVDCMVRTERYVQITVSTGGGKRYRCDESLSDVYAYCAYLPDYPTYMIVDLMTGTLTRVGLTAEGKRCWVRNVFVDPAWFTDGTEWVEATCPTG